jgi:hypothetical protein
VELVPGGVLLVRSRGGLAESSSERGRLVIDSVETAVALRHTAPDISGPARLIIRSFAVGFLAGATSRWRYGAVSLRRVCCRAAVATTRFDCAARADEG